jgi:hypothetical protein
MGVRWSQLLGNTERFAVALQFEDDPDLGVGATKETAASWGAFQIWVRGQNLCAHLEEGEQIQWVHWYLLPLLEWIADNWQPIFHEEKPPVRNVADGAWENLDLTAFPPVSLRDDEADDWEKRWFEWRGRHSFQSCREGGLFPDVVIRRWRDRIEISWGETPIAGAPEHYRFLSGHGVDRLHPRDVAQPLYEIVRAAAEFLRDEIPSSPRLARLVKRIDGLPSAPTDDKLAWMVGLGRSWPEMRAAWTRTKEVLSRIPNAAKALEWTVPEGLVAEGTCEVALMFGSASPRLDREDVLRLARRAISTFVPAGVAEKKLLRELISDEPVSATDRLVYQDGYDLAERLLGELEVDLESSQIRIDDLLERLGVGVEEERLNDKQIRALSVAGP